MQRVCVCCLALPCLEGKKSSELKRQVLQKEMQAMQESLLSWLRRTLKVTLVFPALPELATVQHRLDRNEFNADPSAWRAAVNHAVQTVPGAKDYFESLILTPRAKYQNLTRYFEKQLEAGEVLEAADECAKLEHALRSTKEVVLSELFYNNEEEFEAWEQKRRRHFPNYDQWYTMYAIVTALRKLKNPLDEVYACARPRVRAFLIAYDVARSLHINDSALIEHLTYELANLLSSSAPDKLWLPIWQTGAFAYHFAREEGNVFQAQQDVFAHMAQSILRYVGWQLDEEEAEDIIVRHLKLFIKLARKTGKPQTRSMTPGDEANAIADVFEKNERTFTPKQFQKEYIKRNSFYFR